MSESTFRRGKIEAERRCKDWISLRAYVLTSLLSKTAIQTLIVSNWFGHQDVNETLEEYVKKLEIVQTLLNIEGTDTGT